MPELVRIVFAFQSDFVAPCISFIAFPTVVVEHMPPPFFIIAPTTVTSLPFSPVAAIEPTLITAVAIVVLVYNLDTTITIGNHLRAIAIAAATCNHFR
jgi:hypothetical protein